MLNSKVNTILKYILCGLVCSGCAIVFAFATNYVYNILKITELLLFEGILMFLLGVSSLLGENSNSIFEKEFLNLITKTEPVLKTKNDNLDSSLEPTIDSYAISIIFMIGGLLSILTTFFI